MLNRENLLSQFHNWLLLKRNYKPNSAIRRLRELRLLFDGACDNGVITYNCLTAYFSAKRQEGSKNAYLNHLLTTARLYTHFAQEKGLLFDAQVLEFSYLKEDDFVKGILSDEEIEAFLALPPPNHTYHNLYNRYTLFFKILAYSGARPNEIVTMKVADVDLGRKVFITNGKTGPREIPIAQTIFQDVSDFIFGRDPSEWLFPSGRGGKNLDGKPVLINSSWGVQFKNRIKRLGINRPHLSTYSLRHSFCTALLDQENTNVFDVKEVMGHSKLETTLRYYHYTSKKKHQTVAKLPLNQKNLDPHEILNYVDQVVKSLELEKKTGIRFSVQKTQASFNLEMKIEER